MQVRFIRTGHKQAAHSHQPAATVRHFSARLFIGLSLINWLLCLPASAFAEIAVTLPPLAGLVTMLDKEAEVFCLLPENADPHHFSLTPRQIDRLQKADLLIRSSRDDGGWQLRTPAPSIDLWPDIDHAWLRPEKVRDILPALAEQLQRLHPKRRERIGLALEKALETCRHIQQDWREALAPLRSKGVIMQHPAWRGLAGDMGIPVWMVLESHRHGHEMGPKKLERATQILKAHPGIRLWGDMRHSNRALNWLAKHGKTEKPVLLDPLGDCGTSWSQLMQQNIARLSP